MLKIKEKIKIIKQIRKMKNYKTTIAGILGAIGIGMQSYPNETVKNIGNVLTAIAMILLGGGAKDFDKTGIK